MIYTQTALYKKTELERMAEDKGQGYKFLYFVKGIYTFQKEILNEEGRFKSYSYIDIEEDFLLSDFEYMCKKDMTISNDRVRAYQLKWDRNHAKPV